MKSPLVEALRQANSGESVATLTDSGSFDAGHDDFGVLANGEDLETGLPLDDQQETDGEIELLEPQELPVAQNSDYFDSVVAMATVVRAAPKWVLYAPYLCFLLALASAGLWFLYQSVDAQGALSQGAPFADSLRDDIGTEPALSNAGERYPFIATTVEVPQRDSAQ